MSFTQTTLRNKLGPERAEEQLRQQCDMFGPEYPKGLDMGRFVKSMLEGGSLEALEPPIFSKKEDRGELAGFNTTFGVGPFQDLSATVGVISDSYGITVETAIVENEEDLTSREGFMIGRMPAVRVIFVP